LKKISIILIIYISAVFNISGEVIPLKTLFGGNGDDFGSCAQQTGDGGYIIIGDSDSYSTDDTSDVYLIKTDAYGYELWHNTYSEDNSFDSGFKVYETGNNDYILACVTLPYNGLVNNINLIRINSEGNVLSKNLYECSANSYNIRISKTGTDSFIVMSNIVSYSGSVSIELVMIDSKGSILWKKTITDQEEIYASEIYPDSDGGFIITGYQAASGNAFQSICLLKTDNLGNILWTEVYSIGNSDGGNYVIPTRDRGYIVLGTTSSFGNPDSSICLIKTDSEGSEEWIKTYGEEGIEFGLSVLQSNDGGFLAAGWTYSYSNGESADIYLIKTDETGEELWCKTYGGPGNDYCFGITETKDSGYIITGFTDFSGKGNADVFLIKTDSEGNIIF
jgi:hypothetical protein